MPSDRQKYNFLAALVKQVGQAEDENDDLYAQWCSIVRIAFEPGETGIEDRVAKLEQWNAQLETAMDSLEQVVSSLDGEDYDEPDGSDEDADMEGDEPQVGSRSQRLHSQPGPVGRAGRQEVTLSDGTVVTGKMKRRVPSGPAT